ncbi:DNA adenine methylase [Anaerorhabdus sp.]|uniref:DNA adenine methylase n=1 Tax=Anaerorhabdus sp. TaxID=1872524 RepID=UPI002FCC0A74
MTKCKKNPLVKPIVKWVGGKRQLLDEIRPFLNCHFSSYIEAFVGGGAVIFDLQPKKAIINDFNEELINVYKVIKENPQELIIELMHHKKMNSEEYFYRIRGLDRKNEYTNLSDIERAARIVYLNKTCYNGLYRVNSSGFFNSPYGKYKNPDIVNNTVIMAMSDYFNKNDIKIISGDYKDVLKKARKGSFVYLDPPYMPISDTSAFTGYTEGGFNYQSQVELRDECIKLHKKGVKFLQSNSYCDEIVDLYGSIEGFKIKIVKAKRSVNSKGNDRGEIDEVLIYNE